MHRMISQNIQHLRTYKGLTQEDMANQLGVARQTVAKWESGAAVPDLDNAAAIATLFDVSVDDLIRHDEQDKGYPIPPRGKHIFGIVRMVERGQIVIPKRAREVFGLKVGSELLLLGDEEQGLALQKAEDALSVLEHYQRVIAGQSED